jgi:Protein of unknown function (DUF1604)
MSGRRTGGGGGDTGGGTFQLIGRPLLTEQEYTRAREQSRGKASSTATSGEKVRGAVWQQQAVDEQGRRRFHGAFTGGFSAGYYNSCGSAEGWTPRQFVSSRAQNPPPSDHRQFTSSAAQVGDGREVGGERATYTLEDVMDDEDYEQIVAGGKTLVARAEFENSLSTGSGVADTRSFSEDSAPSSSRAPAGRRSPSSVHALFLLPR